MVRVGAMGTYQPCLRRGMDKQSGLVHLVPLPRRLGGDAGQQRGELSQAGRPKPCLDRSRHVPDDGAIRNRSSHSGSSDGTIYFAS